MKRETLLRQLLAAAGFGATSEAPSRWTEELVNTAEEEKLAPLLGSRIVAGELSLDSEALAERLRAAHRRCVGQQMAAESALAPLLETTQGAGIAVLAIKGLALLHSVYPRMGERPMADVDLLVQPQDWRRLLEAVEAVGGRIAYSGERPLTDRLFHEVHGVLPPGFVVDLHRGLHSWPLFPFEVEELFKAASPVEASGGTGGGALLLPQLEDQLILIATHAAKDGYFVPLRDVVDSLALLQVGALAEGLPNRLVERAQAWQCQRAVATWLRGVLRFGGDTLESAEEWRGAVQELDPRGKTAALGGRIPLRFQGPAGQHPWILKGRLARAQDRWWRGAAFLITAGSLYGVDAVLRSLSPKGRGSVCSSVAS